MFAELEARLNRVAMEKLSNATAVIAGADVPVIFDSEYKPGMVGVIGMGAACPQMVISSAAMPAGFMDSTIQVNGAAWTVVEVQRDGNLPEGLSLVVLEKP